MNQTDILYLFGDVTNPTNLAIDHINILLRHGSFLFITTPAARVTPTFAILIDHYHFKQPETCNISFVLRKCVTEHYPVACWRCVKVSSPKISKNKTFIYLFTVETNQTSTVKP